VQKYTITLRRNSKSSKTARGMIYPGTPVFPFGGAPRRFRHMFTSVVFVSLNTTGVVLSMCEKERGGEKDDFCVLVLIQPS
jgi:hypothetical protein